MCAQKSEVSPAHAKAKKSSNRLSPLFVAGIILSAAIMILGQIHLNDINDPSAYLSVNECMRNGEDPYMCEYAFEVVSRNYVNMVQFFLKKENCEERFGVGRCVTNAKSADPLHHAVLGEKSNVSFYVPAMAGILMSHTRGDPSPIHYVVAAFYRDVDGGVFTGMCDQNICDRHSSNYVGAYGEAISSSYLSSWHSMLFWLWRNSLLGGRCMRSTVCIR